MKVKMLSIKLLAGLLITGAVAAPLTADAQRWRDRDRQDGNYREQRGGRYAGDQERLINRVEESSNAFRDAYERALRNGILPGTERNDNLKDRIQRLDEAVEDLRRDYDRSDSRRDTRSRVAEVLDRARPVDRVFRQRLRVASVVRGRWERVRAELNILARAYNLNALR